jgi:hypothetical protein
MFYIFWIAVFILIVSIIPIIILFKSLFFGNRHDVVLFSPLQGKLTYQGESASGAQINRTLAWKNKSGETESFFANEAGEFFLPMKAATIRIPGLAQLVVHQYIEVIFKGQSYPVWTYGKMERELNSELGGSAVNLLCELTDEVVRVEAPNGSLGTSFKWTYIEKV